MSYQLWHIHISLPWCSQPNRNREMEPSLCFLYPPFFPPLLRLTFHLTSFFNLFPTRFPLPRRLVWPLLPSYSLTALNYYYTHPLLPLFSLCPCVLSHFLSPPLSSPFNFSFSPLCSPLTPSSERPIRLHRGFTGWGCEGKPKWNAAHLLEWNQDGFSSITPYAPPGLLLLQLQCTALKNHQTLPPSCVNMCVSADFSLTAYT